MRLQELGRVVDSVQNDKVAAWYKNQRGIVLAAGRSTRAGTRKAGAVLDGESLLGRAVATLSNYMILAGSFTSFNNVSLGRLARINPLNTYDSTFNTGTGSAAPAPRNTPSRRPRPAPRTESASRLPPG